MIIHDVKKAGITIEVMLSASLAIVVLFLILGLFGNNLKTMMTGSGFKRVFTNNTTSADQSFDEYTNSKEIVSSQGNYRIVGEQGVEKTVADWEIEAQGEVDKLKDKTSLTDAERMNLAKWLTILGMANPSPSKRAECRRIGLLNKIDLQFSQGHTIVSEQNDITWSNDPNTMVTSNDSITFKSDGSIVYFLV